MFESKNVSSENHRFYIITQWAYLIGLFGHIFAAFWFNYIGVTEMLKVNLFYSIPCFVLAFYLNRLGQHNFAFLFAFIELLIHQILSTYYLSWGFGAYFWLFYLAGLAFFNPFWKTHIQLGLLVIVVGSYIFMYLNYQEGTYNLSTEDASMSNLGSAITTLIIVSLLINYYSKAAKKAEEKLIHEQEKTASMLEKVGALFGQQVSEEIAQELISNEADFESKNYDVSVMFMDIRDFTVFADSHEPGEVAKFQNAVFSELIQIVKEYKGVVLQILGDGIMAVFGAPTENNDHAQFAVEAGQMMIHKVEEMGDKNIIPKIRVGIGINSGKVIAGNVGNQSRRFYSLTGKNVIIAARIESLNKLYKSQLLISGFTFNKLKNKPTAEHLGLVSLKGIENDVEIYKLI